MGDYSPIFFVEASRLVNCGDIFNAVMISSCQCCLIYQRLKDYFVEKLTMDLVYTCATVWTGRRVRDGTLKMLLLFWALSLHYKM